MVFRTSMAPRDLIPWPEGGVGTGGGRRWLVVGVVLAVAGVVGVLVATGAVTLPFTPWFG